MRRSRWAACPNICAENLVIFRIMKVICWRIQRVGQPGASASMLLGLGPKSAFHGRAEPHKTRAALRSIPLAQWTPLLELEGLHFVDLQYTDCEGEIAALAEKTGVRIYRWCEVRDDFEETAALVAELDLVISVCTTVIHLAGALGKPVWIMTPFSPEWRYGFQGETMPWYPS